MEMLSSHDGSAAFVWDRVERSPVSMRGRGEMLDLKRVLMKALRSSNRTAGARNHW